MSVEENEGASSLVEYRPEFYIAQHSWARDEALSELDYEHIVNAGFGAATTPITNRHFEARIEALLKDSETRMALLEDEHPGSQFDPIVTPLTSEDTALTPSFHLNGLLAYASPWIDLGSPDPLIASISRQALNLEVAYANFCGLRSVIIPGPRRDEDPETHGTKCVAQYARGIQEILRIASRMNVIIHMPMYREPGLEEVASPLGALRRRGRANENHAIDIFSAWDSWNVIRTVCEYDQRLFVALKVPRVLPEAQVQSRWFSEPMQYLSLYPQTFQKNATGHPSLSRAHQDLINHYMTLKHAPYFLLCSVGPDLDTDDSPSEPKSFDDIMDEQAALNTAMPPNEYVEYLRDLERRQKPMSQMEKTTLSSFQDWLQSPLQPLSDNLESATYEVFEGDPVKYRQYESAIQWALAEWKEQGKPTSSLEDDAVVIAVVGAGRGPLVERALRASERMQVPVKVFAIEKNPNAYVYLLRQNQMVWGNQVTVVKTDMRAWKGPVTSSGGRSETTYGKVDILVSELLGSFGDNELSPECLDGIQHVLAPKYGISIPSSYTAHVSPIATPRIFSDISQRFEQGNEINAFSTPWVVRLYALDYMAERVPGHDRFQKAWEFSHPIPQATMDDIEKKRAGGLAGGGGGSMAGGVGTNEHNSRHCHLRFVCRSRGVIHGLAGYFEAVLYKSTADKEDKFPLIEELSIRPDTIDKKSKDMVSWFPIFFPLKKPLYVPTDAELEVSMWRQTDDTKVWYEWMVEAFMWTGDSEGRKTRLRVSGSDLCSSRKIACLM